MYKTCIAQAKIKCVLGILFIIENILVILKCSNVQNQVKLINKKLLLCESYQNLIKNQKLFFNKIFDQILTFDIKNEK